MLWVRGGFVARRGGFVINGITGCKLFVFAGIMRGEYAELVFEVFAEVFEVVEACFVGYFGDAELAFAQELRGSLEAYDADKFDGRFAGDGEELFVEVHATHSEFTAQLLN